MKAENVKELLQPLFEKARKENLMFYHNSIAGKFWFTPDELQKLNDEGRFVWGPDNWQLKQKPSVYNVANCRGKNPMITDIKRALRLLSGVKSELNDCSGKDTIKEVMLKLEQDLIEDDPNILIYK